MSDRYVVGFDGTDQSRRAVDFAAAKAKSAGAQIHLVKVIEWSPYSFHTAEELAERHGRREQELNRAAKIFESTLDALKADGIQVSCEARHGNAAEILCKIAEEKNADQIVIGRTGDSAFAQRLLGGLAITLAQVAPLPLTIVP